MFGLVLAASSACVAACAAPAGPAPDPAALTAASAITVSSSDFAPLSRRSGLGDALGRGWRSGSADLGGGDASLRLSVYDSQTAERPVSAPRAPIPDFSSDQPAFRLDLAARMISAEAGELSFDLGPRAVFASGPEGRSAGAGVVARLGQNFQTPRQGEPSWYFFAGADARAVKLDPESPYFGIRDARIERQAIVGDAQAGVAFDMGPADLALAYVRRERDVAGNSWGAERTDGFAVISMSLRH